MKPQNKHSTNDELVYIQQIGQASIEKNKPSKKVLLKNYINALALRVDWIGMDKKVIEAAARQELANC